VLLRRPAIAVGVGRDLVDEDVALLVQVAEEPAHEREDRFEIGGLLVLRVGAVDDLDVEPEARLAVLGEALAADDPVLRP
jgi:hypothetical protein